MPMQKVLPGPFPCFNIKTALKAQESFQKQGTCLEPFKKTAPDLVFAFSGNSRNSDVLTNCNRLRDLCLDDKLHKEFSTLRCYAIRSVLKDQEDRVEGKGSPAI